MPPCGQRPVGRSQPGCEQVLARRRCVSRVLENDPHDAQPLCRVAPIFHRHNHFPAYPKRCVTGGKLRARRESVLAASEPLIVLYIAFEPHWPQHIGNMSKAKARRQYHNPADIGARCVDSEDRSFGAPNLMDTNFSPQVAELAARADANVRLQQVKDPIDASAQIPKEVVQTDVELLLWSLRLHNIRRFHHQRFWEDETRDSDYAAKIEKPPRLESVSEHSWHVADIVLVVAPHFQGLNIERCLTLAILHDKLEIIIGDMNPIGRDGRGTKTHAFNPSAQRSKNAAELCALKQYLARVRGTLRDQHQLLFSEMIEGRTEESRFVKAIDKLQSLAYVHLKKDGQLEDRHIEFTLRYTYKAVKYFPAIEPYCDCLRDIFIQKIASRREMAPAKLHAEVKTMLQSQLPLFDEDQ